MHEVTITRHNIQIDPVMHIWEWQIPVYLFLGGLVAGMMMIGGYFLLSGRHKTSRSMCYTMPLLGIVFLSLGMFALFLDLEHKLYVWRLYTTFQPTSPMSWGSWILLLVYPALLATILLKIHEHIPFFLKSRLSFLMKLSSRISDLPNSYRIIGIVNMALGAVLGMYTGILLSALGARPLWNSSILWFLFVISGLSAAAAFVHLIAQEKFERELLAKADNGFLIIELFVIVLFLVGLLSSTAAHQNAAKLLLIGEYAAPFWVFVVGIGIVIPLVVQSLAVTHKVKHTPIAPLLVIGGGIVLRFIIVAAGQQSSWLLTPQNNPVITVLH
ncbi:MAG: polysulfide reductase NrfD [bacterium]|nr:polysulfide reductase NrfD [bacterium]